MKPVAAVSSARISCSLHQQLTLLLHTRPPWMMESLVSIDLNYCCLSTRSSVTTCQPSVDWLHSIDLVDQLSNGGADLSVLLWNSNRPIATEWLQQCTIQPTAPIQILYFTTPTQNASNIIMNVNKKPSWCKGKRAKAVRVYRPRPNKSTANQLYVISYW